MNKKVVTLVIVFLVLLVLTMSSYIVYDKVILDNKKTISNKKTDDNNEEKEEVKKVYKVWEEVIAEGREPIIFNCLNEVGEKECTLIDDKNLNVTLKKEIPNIDYVTWEVIYLYINDVKVDFIAELVIDLSILSVEKIDHETILVTIDGFDYKNSYYLVDKDGKEVSDFTNVARFGGIDYIDFKDGVFVISSSAYALDYEAALCRDYNEDDYAFVEEEIKYMGNGKFSEGKIIKSGTVGEIIKAAYNMSCEELKNSTDPELSYYSALARGEM